MKTLFKVFVLIIVIFQAAMASQNCHFVRLDNGDKYIPNKIIIVEKIDLPGFVTGHTVMGIAHTGIESIDRRCRNVEVLSIEPFYPWRLTKPALVRDISRMYIATLADGADAQNACNLFLTDSNIEAANLYTLPELCYVPNDPRLSEQWYLQFVHAYTAWDIIRGDTTRHSVIGILDSGVHWDHPDISRNIWINLGEDANHNGIYDPSDNDGVDSDSNGFVDDVVGWNFGGNNNNIFDDDLPHGTAVAGCASEATDNGLYGASLGYSARIMGVNIFDGGMPTYAYQGMVYAVENGANVINCSWGLTTYSQAEQNVINAVWEAGGLIVASAGARSDTVSFYPAAYNHVLAVAATDQYDHKASFSGYGAWIDLCAPGINIWTTIGNDQFVEYSGTSFSTALVSGAAALIWARNPLYTGGEVENVMRLLAVPLDSINPGYAGRLGSGRIDFLRWPGLNGIATENLPNNFALDQNYPNPFNGITTISYNLPERSFVTLSVYDLLGHKLETLCSGIQDAGPHVHNWDSRNASSGLYFYRLKAGLDTSVKKMTIIK
jgi:hypothetical protein